MREKSDIPPSTLGGKRYDHKQTLGDPEVTANLYSNFAYLYWEGCVICSIYLRYILGHPVELDALYASLGGNSPTGNSKCRTMKPVVSGSTKINTGPKKVEPACKHYATICVGVHNV